MPRSKLAQLLLEEQAAKTAEGEVSSLSTFGLEHLTDISKFLKQRIRSKFPKETDFDPLFQIAQIALTTDDASLSFRCNAELAKYQYPQIRSLEVNAQRDNEIKIRIEMAGYAAGSNPTDDAIEVEDFEAEGDIDAEEEEKGVEHLESQQSKPLPMQSGKKVDYLAMVAEQSKKPGRGL